MKSILWEKPEGDYAYTSLAASVSDSAAHAAQMLANGDVPADWAAVAFDSEPPPAPPYVPQQVTRAQGKAALITSGLWTDVESYVDSITDPTEKALALVALNDTTHWQRTSPFLNDAAAALGLSDEDLDNLFIQASEIQL